MKKKNKKHYMLNIAIIIFISLFAISFLSPLEVYGIEKTSSTQSPIYGKNPEIGQIKPKKPVKIKLKRSNKGEYSWDLSGDNVEDIVKVDKRLRKLLEIE
ncbi:MAG: hypothetical protein N3A59_06010 [Thermodesulfovibrionales bacterium]|nr:hypothetical protein [Thermodesulfovibrionales bacterium]